MQKTFIRIPVLTIKFIFIWPVENTKKKINDFISFNIIKPIISSKLLRSIGIDADTTDLAPINPWLFKKLKSFDLIHTTDQLFTMAKTAKKVSKKFNIPFKIIQIIEQANNWNDYCKKS